MIGCSEIKLQSIMSRGEYAWSQMFGDWVMMTKVSVFILYPFDGKYYDDFLLSYFSTLLWISSNGCGILIIINLHSYSFILIVYLSQPLFWMFLVRCVLYGSFFLPAKASDWVTSNPGHEPCAGILQ